MLLKFDTKLEIEKMVKDIVIEKIYYVKLDKNQINRLYNIIYIMILIYILKMD